MTQWYRDCYDENKNTMIEIKKYNRTILTPLWAFMDKFSQNVDKQL